MIELQAATLLVGWAAGGWFFLWVTTRRREVGLGYGWLMRGIFLALAAGSLVAAFATEPSWSRDAVTLAFIAAGVVASVVSVVRRSAGTSGQRAEVERRSARVAQMTGIDRVEARFDASVPEFPPVLDLVAAAVGLLATLAGAIAAEGPTGLAVARTLVGALFTGAVLSAM
ncbi:MAG: hypothetical protein OXG66_11505, partial [Acidimicrobiaceae bacterium]|nr:hypothetical protein [Acidimicrobiaceae bacterium]